MDSTVSSGRRQRAKTPDSKASSKNRPKRAVCQLADNRAENDGFSNEPLFRREDWTLFRNLSTLGQRAGVAQDSIPELAAKELVDNALDASGECKFGLDDQGRLYVQDFGNGLDGTDADIGDLFSVKRPLSSSKLLRLPTRGALGNGLRVVAGAVLASDGELIVKTRGRALRLRPRDSDGGTDVEHIEPWNGTGTRVEVLLGDSLPINNGALKWAKRAMRLTGGKTYKGKPSPYWYDADSFYELTQAAGTRAVRKLVEAFAGCSGAKASRMAAQFSGSSCESLTRDEAESLLDEMRDNSHEVQPKHLGAVGPMAFPDAGYARDVGTFEAEAARGCTDGTIPYVLEAWATNADEPRIEFNVNRTPITAEIGMSRCMKHKGDYGVMGCGLSSEHGHTALPIKVGRGREFSIVMNVITPYMPITTDGKAPDLSVIQDSIQGVAEKAIHRAKRRQPGNGREVSQIAVIREAIPAAIDKASGQGQYRYSLRQLFYAVRPEVLSALGIEPNYGYFGKVVTDHEAETGGDLPGMYRDDRGTLYHPHTSEQIPLGTRSVEAYKRPEWTFNKVVYCEKEGFFPILIDAHWPERHDCALLTSKGFASRAARDVLDLLGDGNEPVKFFCIHDADGPGTVIYQSLQEGTKARPGRRVEIINLGLDPAEALEMGLPVEPVEKKARAVPVADYIEPKWREWLQEHRVELNAMDTPTFLAWLDAKMEPYAGKLIPPQTVLAERLAVDVRGLIRQRLVDEAIRAARVDEQTEATIASLQRQIERVETRLLRAVEKDLAAEPVHHWSASVNDLARTLAAIRRRKPNG